MELLFLSLNKISLLRENRRKLQNQKLLKIIKDHHFHSKKRKARIESRVNCDSIISSYETFYINLNHL